MYMFFILCLGAGCDNAINPSAPSEPRLVVFSVLSTQSDTQFVRVYSSYNAPDNNPLLNNKEQVISDARVIISDGINLFPFQYRTLGRPDTSRYSDSLGIYYCFPFRPQEGKEYRLTVISPRFGQAIAKTRIPGSGRIECTTPNELQNTSTRRPILVQFQLSDLAKAQLIRFYIVYTDENPWEPEATRGKEKYVEVPAFWKILDLNFELHEKIYSKPTLRTARLSRRGQPASMTFWYEFPTYAESQYAIQHYNFNVRFKRAVFYLIQFDEEWYKYYAAVNLFQDRLAVRLDPPDYSNVQGGFGLFGSFRVDSTVVPLPEYIRPYR